MYCMASRCARAGTCKRHISHEKYESAVDWSTYGSGRISNDGSEITYYCGDDSGDYPKYDPIDSVDNYLDMHGNLLKEGDIIRFENGHRFKLIVVESTYCLLSMDLDLPLLLVDKICMDNQFYSGRKEVQQ